MNKKILDAAVVTVFCMGLFTVSDIEESMKGSTDTAAYALEQSAGKTEMKTDFVSATAGAIRVLSEDSFTTESDEVAYVKRNQRFFVTAPQAILDEGSMGESRTAMLRTSMAAVQAGGEEAEQSGMEEISSEGTIAEPEESSSEGTIAEQEERYNNRWNITLTEDEIELLARIVWLEANGEPVEGQKAVVEVIFNRMASELFPNTLYDVLSQKNPVQFCSWKNREKAKPTEKEYESIRQVLEGNTQILRNDTLYFSVEPLTSNVDVKIGGHSFCY